MPKPLQEARQALDEALATAKSNEERTAAYDRYDRALRRYLCRC